MLSIRRNLLKWHISSLLFIGTVTTLITLFVAWHAFSGLRDDGLAQIAYSILRHGTITDDESDEDIDDPGHFSSQVWDNKGQLVYSSLPNDGPPLQTKGYHTYWWHGEKWRTFTFEDGDIAIQVGNPISHRYELFIKMAGVLMLPLLLMISALTLLIRYVINKTLTPLQEIRAEVLQQHVSNLSNIDLTGLPEEIAPLGQAVNDLFNRLSALINKQSEFISNAAHELKTPLTAVRLQTQLVIKTDDPFERERGLQQLLNTVDRSSRLVDQLLQMARLENSLIQQKFSDLRLDFLVQEIVAELTPLAETKHIDCGITQLAQLTIKGHQDSLGILMTNLIENAIRYTPNGGQVDIALSFDDHAAILCVSDTGPGIKEQYLGKVFDRFFRVQDEASTGSGLGLSIAKLIADLHNGHLSLVNRPEGGLNARFTMHTPKPE